MNWKEYERKQSEHNLRHYMGFSWIAWGKPKKTSVIIVSEPRLESEISWT